MGVFLRYISRSMLEKKGRFVLLIISIMISTALLIVSLGLIDVIIYSYTEPAKSAAEGQDAWFFSNTEDVYFSMEDFDADGFSNLEGRLTYTAVLNEDDEICYVNLTGRHDYKGNLIEGNITDSNKPECIMSKRIADEKDISIGDKITLATGGKPTEFTVTGIASNEGFFYSDKTKSFKLVVPYEYLNQLLKAGGRYNFVTARADGDSPKKAVEKFNDNNERVKASEYIPEDLADGSETITVPMYCMLAIVCIICIIIINGVFKLIINERIKVIGTFMSQGATKKKIERILLAEALLYGLVGAAVGIVVGEVALIFVTRYFSPLKDYGIYVPYKINVFYIICGILFAVALCVISAWTPVRRIRKMQPKDVILDRLETQHKRGTIRTIIGIVLLALAVVASIVPGEWTEQGSILFMFLGLLGLAMMSRKFLKVVSGAISKTLRGNTTAFLSMNNIASSKLLRGNITLLTISLSAVLLIASIGATMRDVVVAAYDSMHCDYYVYNFIDNNAEETTTDKTLEVLRGIDGIDKDSLGKEYMGYGKINDSEESVYIISVDDPASNPFAPYLEFDTDKYKDILDKYNASEDKKDILISTQAAKNADVKEGDTIELNVDEKKAEFRIAGIYDGKLFDNGTTIFIDPEVFSKTYNVREAESIYFSLEEGADAEKVEQAFKKPLANLGVSYMTIEEMKKENVDSNQMVIDLLAVFSYLALGISAIGIFNNITICFSQRRKEFAVMASVGMNASKRRRLVLSESLFCTLWCVAISIPFGMVMSSLASKMMRMNGTPMDIALDWASLPKYIGVLVGVIFLATITTMRKSGKLKVVEELKYE